MISVHIEKYFVLFYGTSASDSLGYILFEIYFYLTRYIQSILSTNDQYEELLVRYFTLFFFHIKF